MAEEEIEKILTVPLKKTRTVPRLQRADRAVTEIKEYVARHMRAAEAMTDEDREKRLSPTDKVWIDSKVNEVVWTRGIEKPPRAIRVRVIRFEDGLIEVSLPEE